jgi:hypothetical protein
MYLFTRRTRLAPGHGTAGVDWARSVAEKARALTGRDLRLWGNVYSCGVGTIWWSGWFESLDALERFGDVLAADPATEKLTNAGARYVTGGFDDCLAEPGYGTSLDDATRYVDALTTVAGAGDPEQIRAAGVAVAQRTEQVTGRPTTFCRGVTGRAGELVWLTGHVSAAAMEAAQHELAADPTLVERLEALRGCVAASPGVEHTIHRRLG